MCMLLLVAALQVPATDTLHLPADSAFRIALARAPQLAASRARERAAAALVGVAGAPRNPTLSVVEENLGAQRQITGRNGLAGLEGQVTLAGVLPLGGDLAAASSAARANRSAAAAASAITDAALREELAIAAAVSERDAALALHARDEASVLDRFAAAMTRRAADGRSAGGEAARARLEAALAASGAARRAAGADTSAAMLSRLLGTEGPVRLVAPACGAATGAAEGEHPELAFASAREEGARQQLRLARAHAIPDLQPQVGWRRTAGFSGLLLGVGIDVPLFTAGRHGIAAARADAEAASADRVAATERLAAAGRGAQAALARLDSAAVRFDVRWQDDLERAVRSAEARLDSGEGTLLEYLDARRARVLALDEYETWRAERRRARAVAARYAGRTIDASTLCDDAR